MRNSTKIAISIIAFCVGFLLMLAGGRYFGPPMGAPPIFWWMIGIGATIALGGILLGSFAEWPHQKDDGNYAEPTDYRHWR